MGLDVYFRRDIANVLRATAHSSEGTARVAEIELEIEDAAFVPAASALRVYRLGVQHALVSVGLAFGLEPVRIQVQSGEQSLLASLLWAESPGG